MNIWSSNSSLYKLDPTTKIAIQTFENENGINLPQEYTNLLLIQNGGEIIYNAFPTDEKTNWTSNHISIEYIFGLGNGQNSISFSSYYIKEWDLPKNILVFNGTGHEWIAFDYRQTTENPPIIYIEVETNKILTLAKDFDSFIQGLYVHDYDDETIDYILPNLDTSHERIHEVFSQINKHKYEEIVDLIYSFNVGSNQKFMINMFILGMDSLDDNVRDRLCTHLYSTLMVQELTENELLQRFVQKVEMDENDGIRGYARILKSFMI